MQNFSGGAKVRGSDQQGKEIRLVLLIEDNEDDVVIIKHLLAHMKYENYELTHASTLEEGKQKVLSQSIEIVLLDLSLPDSSDFCGVETLHAVRPGLPIVILTGHDDWSRASEFFQKGVEDYLVKGQIDANLLERVLRHSIDRSQVKAELALAHVALKELVGQDPLTGTLNRRGFQDILGKIFAVTKRTGVDLHALLIDLDDFKDLNEKYGYGIGDLALKEVSKAIKQSIRTSDYVARVGGDEFIVLLVNTREEDAFHVTEKLRLAISKCLLMADTGKVVEVTCSIGLAVVDDGCEILEGLFKKLENSLRHSKELGKNRITFQKNDEFVSTESVEETAKGSHAFIKKEDLYAVCQPIYELKSRTVVAYEMLARTRNNPIENVTDLFLLARQQNLMTWVDFQCFRTCLQTAADLPQGAKVHINLLPSTLITLHAERLNDEISRLCPGKSILLELSEKQIMGEPMHLLTEVNKLKELGCRIAIDDVGFGYSSLESLVILEPHIVKIDGICIYGIATDGAKQAQFKRLVKVIEACAMQYIVEGIENQPSCDFLVQNGVQFGQGYLLCKPEMCNKSNLEKH